MGKSIAIITARGGSKRIPFKNIRDFLGKPIIAYSIEAAIQSDMFEEIMVSTDHEDIANVAKEYGAKVPFMRSPKNSDDYSGTVDVLLEVIKNYNELGKNYDYGCCIYPTAPFITGKLIRESHKLLIDKNYDTVFPIVSFSSPIQRALKIKKSRVEMFQPEFVKKRSQDLEQTFFDTGQLYWFKTAQMMSSKELLTKNSGGIIVSELQAQDIDNEEDWKIAEMKYKVK